MIEISKLCIIEVWSDQISFEDILILSCSQKKIDIMFNSEKYFETLKIVIYCQ